MFKKPNVYVQRFGSPVHIEICRKVQFSRYARTMEYVDVDTDNGPCTSESFSENNDTVFIVSLIIFVINSFFSAIE